MKRLNLTYGSLLKVMATALGVCAATANAQEMPAPAPIPSIPAPEALGSVPLGDPSKFPEVKLDFPIANGPFQATWASIAQNYPSKEVPWLRAAKVGFWVHFGPQAVGRSGDWYARSMYMPDKPSYNNHLRDYGHPSVVGYKNLLHTWNPVKLDPVALVQLYKDAGARFLLIQGVHHDNFDNWNSTYQPWNSVNMGPHRDILGEWSAAAHKADMRMGVSFHHEYTWWWWQPAFHSDSTGKDAGVPYDGNLTLADAKGKWWEGYDLRLLYGIDLREYQGFDQNSSCPKGGILINHLDYCKWYATRWALRILDVINKYDPDFIFTDGNSQSPFDGLLSSTGYKCDAIQRVIADYYNHTLQARGKVDTFSIVKFHPPCNGVVTTCEACYPKGIKTDQPWIGETPNGDWYYAPGFVNEARGMIRYMLECVSRDGNFCVNIAMMPDGSLDDSTKQMLRDMGDWMKINGEGIYGSRAWATLGEGANGVIRSTPQGYIGANQANFKFEPTDFRFTVGKGGSLYAFCMTVPAGGTQLKIASMGSDSRNLTGSIQSVELFGSSAALYWQQKTDGLYITCPTEMPLKISAVFKITTR
jgi:alpha-L-fucosidase